MSQVTDFQEPVVPDTKTVMVKPTVPKYHGLGGKSLSAIRKERKRQRLNRKAGRR